jgi:leader peptidase (prepilin peptidase) / N-methyltransferase
MDLSMIGKSWSVIGVFGLLGLCIGSFVNVVTHRLPIILRLGPYEDGRFLQELLQKHGRYTLSLPRSECPCCGSQINARHNIPLLGWLVLRGKCNDCAAPINITYPATELLFGVAFAAYVSLEGMWLAGLMTLPMMTVGYCIAVIRFQTGRFVGILLLGYFLLLLAQVALTQFGYSSYSA